MQVIICGGRNFNDKSYLFSIMDQIIESKGIHHVIAGGARGADTLAIEWATNRGIPYTIVHADWDQYGRRAGYLRNTWMLNMLNEQSEDFVVAFPGGVGTAHMVRIAKRHYPVLEV